MRVSPLFISNIQRLVRRFLLPLALAFSAALFIACPMETGSDPEDTIPLAGARSIQVTAKNESLVLQWTKIAPAQGIVPSYAIYYSRNNDPAGATYWGTIQSNASQLVAVTIGVRTDPDDKLINHVTYYIWVKAMYAGLGESNFSSVSTGIPIPPPATPGVLTVSPGEAMLGISWAKVEDAYTYEVYYKSGGHSDAAPPSDTQETMKTVSVEGAVLPGLTNDADYTVWVRALNTAGISPGYSRATGTPKLATTPPAPDKKPGVISITAGNEKLALAWDQVPGVPQYKLYYNTTDDFATATALEKTVPAAAPQESAEITMLSNGTSYYVWVQSWNSQSNKDNSPQSDSASGTPEAKPAIDFSNLRFALGTAKAEFIFAQDLPPSVFFYPDGRPNTDRLTRVQETALGDLFTDAAAWYVRNKLGEAIDFVFLNGGYIDNVLPEGTVTVGTIAGIVQPDSRQDKFFLLTLTGAQLKQFFNDEAAKADNLEPGDVSGVVHTGRGGPHNTGFWGIVSKDVRYTLQYYQPPLLSAGEIASSESEPYLHGFIDPESITIDGKTIVDTQSYRICTTDYNASGEYFTRLYTDGTDKKLIETPFWHGIAEYVYDQGAITPTLDGRIKVEGGVNLPAPWVPGTLVKP